MELLKHEWKKIWNPLLVLVLLLLGVLYYYLFCDFYIEFFHNGAPTKAAFSLSAAWAEAYGPTMETEERAGLDEQLTAEYERFAECVQACDRAADYGIVDWDSFDDFYQNYYESARERGGEWEEEKERVIGLIVNNSNYHEIVFLQRAIETYDRLENEIPPNLNYDGIGDSDTLRTKKLARIREIKDSDMVHGYLPVNIIDNTWSYAARMAVWCILSVILLLSPTLVRDRLRRTRSMQWTSRKGRRIWNTQLLAAVISAIALTALNMIAYTLPFLAQGPLVFKDFRLFSFLWFGIPWVDWTYGRYLIVIEIMIFLMTMTAAGFTVMLSQYSGHYIAMLLKALPLFTVMAYISAGVLLDRSFFFGNPLSEWLELPGAELLGIAALILTAAALVVIAWARQTRREIEIN